MCSSDLLKDRASDADLRAAIKTFRNATQRIRDDSEKWSIPKTPEARALVDIYRANLERRVEVIDDFGPQIVEIMANSLIGTRQKAEKARVIFDEATKRIEAEATALVRAQREYAATAGVFAFE